MIEFHLDHRSGVATYLQLVQQVKQALRLGTLRPGDKLPTAREVVETLAINPNTVLKAYRELLASGQVKVRDTVLIQGTGGVSLFALQFARASGARVIGISSSDEKLERARRLGLETGINYRRTPEWGDEVQKLTGGRGVDHVIEVGGAGTLARSMQALAFGGRIALIGVLSGHQGDTNPHPLVMKGGSMHGVVVGNRAMFERMNRAIEINGIRPVIDRVFPFAEARAAYEYQQSGALFGKVVIAI